MKIKYLTLICLYLFLCSCKSAEEKNVNKIVINNNSVPELLDISGKINDLQIIPLKETPGNFIGSAYKIFFVRGQYIIFDRINTHKVNLYDGDGKFLKNIIKVGDDPNDALTIMDCWLNDEHNLEVYDFAQKKIYRFDKQFTLKNTIKSKEPSFFNNLSKIKGSDNYIAYADRSTFNPPKNNDLYQFALLDKDLKIINTYLPYDKKFQGVSLLNFATEFHQYDDRILFSTIYDNYLYELKNGEVEKAYKLVYTDHPLPDDVMNDIVGKHLSIFLSRTAAPNEKSDFLKNYAYFYGTWLENENSIYIKSLGRGFTPFVSWINKKNNTVEGSGRFLCDTKNYKLRLPYFQYYDNESKSYISTITGSDLNQVLMEGSVFKNKILPSPEQLYIVKMKLN